MAVVELDDIRLRYGTVEVLKGISLRIEASEFAAVLGPSGCGKTSLLNIIAGFSDYTGSLRIDGQDVANIPPHRRNIGIVFQDYALFPHKTVAENIGYGLRLRSVPREKIRSRIDELVALLKLGGLTERYPAKLSGGQRQRVAIARALAIEPKMLLLDEPLSALDKKLREEMQVELRQIQRTVGITTLFVTHDQEEALALADRVIVMNSGLISQIGTPADIYLRPADPFVAGFIGRSNFFNAEVIDAQGESVIVRTDTGEVLHVRADRLLPKGCKIVFSVRPERIRLGRRGDVNTSNTLNGRIEHVIFMGAQRHVRVVTESKRRIDVTVPEQCAEGEEIALSWHPSDAVILSRDPG
jgi:spermidine/putrescine ABC transporter ATP-binding subunit